MKKVILSLACLTGSFSAFASQYRCHSIDNKVEAFLVFDDVAGSLDALYLTAYGVDYTDVNFDKNSKVIEVETRDTFKHTREFGNDKLEIGFTGKNGAKFDIFVEVIAGNVLDGTLYSKVKGKKSAVAFTCLDLRAS